MTSKAGKKNYASTQPHALENSGRKSATKRVSLTQNTSIAEMTSEEFETRILDVNIKKPRSAYNFYIADMQEKEGSGKSITEAGKEFSKKWPKLSAKEKEKYEKQAQEDKERYNEHLLLVKKYIVSKPLREAASGRDIFIDEQVTEKMENGMDSKEARKEAIEAWRNMTTNQKEVYEEKKEKHRELYEDIKKAPTANVSGYTLFCRDKMVKARENNEKMTLPMCAEAWNKAKDTIKEKYDNYAEEIREERRKNRDLYEMAYGVKPKRPLGPYNFYLMELSKEGKFTGFKDAAKSWRNTSDEDKEKYLRVAKKAQLAYQMKKQEYNSSVRKSYTRTKSAFNFFVADQKDKNYPDDLGQGGFFNWCYDKWMKTSDEIKKKYEKMAEQSAKASNREREELDNKVFEQPKKPINGYARFVKERVPQLKEKNPDTNNSEFFGMVAEEWRNMKIKNKEKYDKAYKEELTGYKDRLREFNKNGYYTPSKEELARKSAKKMSMSNRSKSKDKVSTKKSKTK
jgi:hypothetical protein